MCRKIEYIHIILYNKFTKSERSFSKKCTILHFRLCAHSLLSFVIIGRYIITCEYIYKVFKKIQNPGFTREDVFERNVSDKSCKV